MPKQQKSEGGKKYDADKSRLDLIPPDALMAVGHVLAKGAEKYGERNWEKGIDLARLDGAILRHNMQQKFESKFDDETGLLHAAHEACAVLMKLAGILRGFEDSRPQPSEFPDIDPKLMRGESTMDLLKNFEVAGSEIEAV